MKRKQASDTMLKALLVGENANWGDVDRESIH